MPKCLKCTNDNPSMFSKNNHQRDQIEWECVVCNHIFIEKLDVPKEQVVKGPFSNDKGRSL